MWILQESKMFIELNEERSYAARKDKRLHYWKIGVYCRCIRKKIYENVNGIFRKHIFFVISDILYSFLLKHVGDLVFFYIYLITLLIVNLEFRLETIARS